MNVDRIVMAFAGVVILASLALSQVHHIYWLGAAAFVGVNMLQASLTKFCPLAIILKKMGVKTGQAFN
ncbi:MAG: DUF2892 domain-containing protein [Rhodospirillales bacterium]|nr:DUF2892 domain-containing protein [Rhodospirillales bacterium]